MHRRHHIRAKVSVRALGAFDPPGAFSFAHPLLEWSSPATTFYWTFNFLPELNIELAQFFLFLYSKHFYLAFIAFFFYIIHHKGQKVVRLCAFEFKSGKVDFPCAALDFFRKYPLILYPWPSLLHKWHVCAFSYFMQNLVNFFFCVYKKKKTSKFFKCLKTKTLVGRAESRERVL